MVPHQRKVSICTASGCRAASILGGVEIPHTKGLLGHSDGDVLCHAITSMRCWGAAGLGNIGQLLFSDSESPLQGYVSGVLKVSSTEAVNLLSGRTASRIENIDSNVLCRKAEVAPLYFACDER